MTWWLWIVLGLVLAAVEILVPGGFFVIFFGAAAVVTGVLSAFGLTGPRWLEWLAFSVLSILSLMLFRRPLLERIRQSESPRGAVDSLAGEAGRALDAMAPGAVGRVELRGSAWSARNASARAIIVGERVVVDQVDGLMLRVRPEGGPS